MALLMMGQRMRKKLHSICAGISYLAMLGFAGAAESIDGINIYLCFGLSAVGLVSFAANAYLAGWMMDKPGYLQDGQE